MKEFGAVDYSVAAVYLLVIAGVGSSFYRRKTTAKEYFLGGNPTPGYQPAFRFSPPT